MGRKKLVMKKIENPTSRQVTYSKRKDGIVKKATELSVLCDIDVGLIMFSPSGRLTTFASNGRIEDIFLRYIDRPEELRGGAIWNEEYLFQSLTQLKYEGEMIEKLAEFYNPELEKITSVFEAQVYQQTIIEAIRQIEQLKAKLTGSRVVPHKPAENIEVHGIDSTKEADSMTEESVDSNGMRNSYLRDEEQVGETGGPHLSLGYLKRQNHWNLMAGGGQTHAPAGF
ncbi:agamous-like MADS-box protein AGL66 isoform X2 [Malania oleifera]|uniref:agamous-like MADS-box protein AGL66 isoform X2 n=1 Tax=Malania oleifera TaxID=397392 RepID=UPI0025AEC982|nr:agamous-like MADS-box protein AGL66 isoform X2 [Malania oleifera]